MSTNYQVWCRTCDIGHYSLHDGGALDCRATIRHAATIAAFDDVVCDRDADFEITNFAIGRIDTAWFKRHLGHDLTVRAEYGDFDDECNEQLTCGTCKHRYARCRRKAGHDGDHSQEPEAA